MSMNPTPTAARVPQWTLGDRLRKARVAAGLNQTELGEQISVSRRQIIDYENDKKRPSRGHLLLWQMITSVPAEWIETGTVPGPDDDPEPVTRLYPRARPHRHIRTTVRNHPTLVGVAA